MYVRLQDIKTTISMGVKALENKSELMHLQNLVKLFKYKSAKNRILVDRDV